MSIGRSSFVVRVADYIGILLVLPEQGPARPIQIPVLQVDCPDNLIHPLCAPWDVGCSRCLLSTLLVVV